MMLPIETIYVFQNDRTLDFKEATNALSCSLATTPRRGSGHGLSCLDLRNSLISRDEMKIGGQVVDKN